MMKRIAALLLALTFLMSMTPAFAWSCPGCGNDMSGKFCTECGTKKPEYICASCGTNFGDTAPKFCTECGTKMETGAANVTAAPTATPTAVPTEAPTATPTATPTAEPTAEPTEAPTATPDPAAGPAIYLLSGNEDGTISMLFHAEMGQSYRVRYVLKQSDSVEADLAAAGGYYEEENTLGIHTLMDVIPGESYWVGAFDAEGRGHYEAFVPDAPVQDFSRFDAFMEQVAVCCQGEDISVLDALTLEQVLNPGSAEYGLYTVMRYDNPGEEQELLTRVAIEAPNGFRFVDTTLMATFDAATEESLGWRCYNLSDAVAEMTERFGAMLPGEYTMTIYLEGEKLGSATFRLLDETSPAVTAVPKATFVPTATPAPTAEPAPVITSIVDNGNGTVSITWDAIDGVAYMVVYFPKRSDDAAADLAAETGLTGVYMAATGGTAQLNKMVPGVAYWVGVCADTQDEPDNYTAYIPQGEVQSFNRFDTELIVEPGVLENSNLEDVDSFCLEDLQKDCVFYLALKYNNPGEEYPATLQIVLEAPGGIKQVYLTGPHTFRANTADVFGDDIVGLANFFEELEFFLEEIPLGDYVVTLYVDGESAGSAVIPVTAERAVKPTPTPAPEGALAITGIVPNGDGTYTLTWAGGEQGNVTVSYWPTLWNQLKSVTRDSTISREIVLTKKAKGGSYLLDCLVPGEEYLITITDKAGNTAEQVITAEIAEPDRNQYAIWFDGQPALNMGGEVLQVEEFSLAEMTMGLIDHGVTISGACYTPAETKDYNLMIALVCANKMKIGIPVGTVHAQAGEDAEFNLGYVDLNACIATLVEKGAGLPDYGWRIEFYLNGIDWEMEFLTITE